MTQTGGHQVNIAALHPEKKFLSIAGHAQLYFQAQVLAQPLQQFVVEAHGAALIDQIAIGTGVGGSYEFAALPQLRQIRSSGFRQKARQAEQQKHQSADHRVNVCFHGYIVT